MREGISRFESENYEEQFEGVKVMGSVGSPSVDFAGSTMCRALNSRAPATKIARGSAKSKKKSSNRYLSSTRSRRRDNYTAIQSR